MAKQTQSNITLVRATIASVAATTLLGLLTLTTGCQSAGSSAGAGGMKKPGGSAGRAKWGTGSGGSGTAATTAAPPTLPPNSLPPPAAPQSRD